MLAQNFKNPAVARKVIVCRQQWFHEHLIRHFQQSAEPVRDRFIGAGHPEIVCVHSHHVAKEVAHHSRGFGNDGSRFRNIHCVIREVGHHQRLE